MTATTHATRNEELAGTEADNIVREHGATHYYRNGSMCTRCKSRVGPNDMVPCHDHDGAKTLTCPHCGVDLINLRS